MLLLARNKAMSIEDIRALYPTRTQLTFGRSPPETTKEFSIHDSWQIGVEASLFIQHDLTLSKWRKNLSLRNTDKEIMFKLLKWAYEEGIARERIKRNYFEKAKAQALAFMQHELDDEVAKIHRDHSYAERINISIIFTGFLTAAVFLIFV